VCEITCESASVRRGNAAMIRILFIEFLVSENASLKSGATMRPTDSLSSYPCVRVRRERVESATR